MHGKGILTILNNPKFIKFQGEFKDGVIAGMGTVEL